MPSLWSAPLRWPTKKPLSCYRPFLGGDRRRWRRVMRYLFTAIAAAAVLLATGSASNRARAADVGPPYGPPSAYGPPPGYSPSDDYSPPPAYGRPPAYGPPPGYNLPDDYGHPSDYDPPRPPRAIPYVVSPVRPACDLQWRCGLRACGWRRVCYPEVVARPYRSYNPPPGPGYYDPY